MSTVDNPDSPKTVTFSRKSDLTLIASDGVQFRVSKWTMSEASEVFEDMFSIPQPTSGEDTSIQLEEDSATLELLLSWIYPSNKCPIILRYEDVVPLFLIARKYNVTLEAIRALLVAPLILKANPLGIYVFCTRHGLDAEQRAAAREVMSQKIAVHGPHLLISQKQMGADFRHVSYWSMRALHQATQAHRRNSMEIAMAKLEKCKLFPSSRSNICRLICSILGSF